MADNFYDIFSGHSPLPKNTSHTHMGEPLAAIFVQHDPTTLALVKWTKGRHLTLIWLIKILLPGIWNWDLICDSQFGVLSTNNIYKWELCLSLCTIHSGNGEKEKNAAEVKICVKLSRKVHV